MTFIPDQYSTNKAKSLEEQISKLSAELAYHKAFLFLDELANTQEMVLVDYLVEAYGQKTMMAFDKEAFRRGNSSEYFMAVNTVKRAISNYKSKTDTKKNPSWAKEAMVMAKIVDEHGK